jgi:hypothetical protein
VCYVWFVDLPRGRWFWRQWWKQPKSSGWVWKQSGIHGLSLVLRYSTPESGAQLVAFVPRTNLDLKSKEQINRYYLITEWKQLRQ